jgi:FAD/FMN-containing dehydrogenase
VCGGAGGVGSVAHGWLWDGNVVGCRIVTAEQPPRSRDLVAAEVDAVIHGYGLTGILTEVTVPLAPRQEWSHLVLTFENLDEMLDFSERLTAEPTIRKRLVSVSESSIVPLFNMAMPLISRVDCHPALLIVAREDKEATIAMAGRYGGTLERELVADRHPMVTDFCFNHVTLWAKKKDPIYTYIQAGFLTSRIHEQIQLVKARYGDSVIHHFEYVFTQGAISPGGLLLLKYESPEQVNAMMAFLQEIGVWVSNPHTYLLEGGARRGNQWSSVFEKKDAYDPGNILNPGKMQRLPVEVRG